MKILLSAFECKPNTGSEFGLGWSWASGLAAMGHEIWVMTLSDNQEKIETELQRNPIPNLHFVYCEMPSWLPWAYKIANLMRSKLLAHMMSQIAKSWWQWSAYRLAKSLIKEINFDLVHQVTNSNARRPSFMGLLGIPFIMGPLSGGVKTPWALRKGYPLNCWLFDLLRDLANFWVRFDPLMNLSFASASTIYCHSPQTQEIIPKLYQQKSEVLFALPAPTINSSPQINDRKSTEKDLFRVLFVGRFLYWKGIHLALKAFAELHRKIPESQFTLVGSGSETAWVEKVAKQLDIDESLVWIPWIEYEKLSLAYLEHDIFLFPSLHEMGGSVILESFCYGLPVVCLDLGGPGVMVDDTCGRVINTDGLNEEDVISALSHSFSGCSQTHLSRRNKWGNRQKKL